MTTRHSEERSARDTSSTASVLAGNRSRATGANKSTRKSTTANPIYRSLRYGGRKTGTMLIRRFAGSAVYACAERQPAPAKATITPMTWTKTKTMLISITAWKSYREGSSIGRPRAASRCALPAGIASRS